ncbi:hypothetical protein ABZP36_017937 [Zizania latifolia]
MASAAEDGVPSRIELRGIGWGIRRGPFFSISSLPVRDGTGGAGVSSLPVRGGTGGAGAVDRGAAPASKELIEALKDVAAADVVDQDCAICLDQAGAGWKETPCGHRFHGECLDKWLSRLGVHGTCPMCRHQMPAAAAAADHEEVGEEMPMLESADEEEVERMQDEFLVVWPIAAYR